MVGIKGLFSSVERDESFNLANGFIFLKHYKILGGMDTITAARMELTAEACLDIVMRLTPGTFLGSNEYAVLYFIALRDFHEQEMLGNESHQESDTVKCFVEEQGSQEEKMPLAEDDARKNRAWASK